MKIIITESQNKHLNLNLPLYRRLPDIERMLNNVLENSEEWDNYEFGFDQFLHDVGVTVGINVADMYDNPEWDNDKYVTFRNQLIRFVKTEFYYQIKQMYLIYTT